MDTPEYDDRTIKLLEHVWGTGYLSPGGSDEVDLIVSKASFEQATVLDLGCGTGGITRHLARTYPLHQITGYDVEAPAHEVAIQRLNESDTNTDKTIQFVLGEPGPLPFDDNTFDIVFTKDALIHVENLDHTLSEIARVLKQQGTLAGCDWMTLQEENHSAELKDYLESEGFEFAPKSINQYRHSMQTAGFTSIELSNRNVWHKEQVQKEIEHISQTHQQELTQKFGKDFIDEQLNAWNHLSVVANKGELFPAHFYCRNGNE